MALPLSPERQRIAEQAVREWRQTPSMTLRKLEARTGLSRSCLNKLSQKIKADEARRRSSPLRGRFGPEPLPVGLGLKMMDPQWRMEMGGAA